MHIFVRMARVAGRELVAGLAQASYAPGAAYVPLNNSNCETCYWASKGMTAHCGNCECCPKPIND